MTLAPLEIFSFITCIILIAGVCTKLFMNKLSDVREITKKDIERLDGRITHHAANADMAKNALTTKVTELERQSSDGQARLIRVEMAVTSFEKGQQRIEQMMEKKFDMLEKSIREIRDVTPAPKS